ncbi:REJ domain protein (macronuclear) [Tetrahymena thermophila SB210]|uniref:REJ domain protein n=1 Tax=Tetrahymena thermophila (strain SB210) TaxID=312017 RepID=Q22BZ3_TETTS|nr:REJ domain protein [Tetrahymena thermophila SB210]EAR82816.2 REJ domain protein [Tetrahymena thermophila SB210]|eukprot:XP_001030479.2 REJ domain protein [Tetrahymena thermophila SB210]
MDYYLFNNIKIIYFNLIISVALILIDVKAQNCSNLISKQTASITRQGYQCIYDSSQNYSIGDLVKTYITQQTSTQFKDIVLSKGDCDVQYLINPISQSLLNDILIDFQGNNGQNLSYLQISFDSYFQLQNGVFPDSITIMTYQKNGGNSYLNQLDNSVKQQSSSLNCKNNYYKKSEYYLIDMKSATSYFTLQTQVHPNTFPNLMANIQILAYYQCPIGCSTCNTSGECSACITNYNLTQKLCLLKCSSNQYAQVTDTATTEQKCLQCDVSCLTCFGKSTNCNTCSNGYYPIITTGTATTFQCVQTCPDTYYLTNNQCKQCQAPCLNCLGDPKSCTSCQNNYYPLISQQQSTTFQCLTTCPNGFQFTQNKCQECQIYSTQSCYSCGPTCKTCQKGEKNFCLDCYDSMTFNGYTCVCKNTQDTRANLYHCSYDIYAAVQATYESSVPILTLEFGSPLVSVYGLSCNQIFDQATNDLLGFNSICEINSTQIIVTLSSDATIMADNIIGFNSKALVLQFQGYSNPIKIFHLISIVQKPGPQATVIVQYNEKVNSCDDISFAIVGLLNDGKRDFFQIQWSLAQPESYSNQTLSNINKIISLANKKQSRSLFINRYIVAPDTSITINLFYILKIQQRSTLSFTTFNQLTKQLFIQSIQNHYPPIYNYMDIKVFFIFYVQLCDQQGNRITKETLDVQVVSKAQPELNIVQNQFNDEQIEIDIKPYSIPLNSTLDLSVQAVSISNNLINSTYNMSITPQISELFIQISGGSDRMVDYQANTTITAVARDYEIQDANSPQGIQLKWTCQNIASNNADSQCYNYLFDVFPIPQNVLSFTIEEGIFNPYQSLKFTLQGQKDSRQSLASVLLIFTEINIPALIVKFDDEKLPQKVNINDDISATLIYDSNTPINLLTYAGAILYKNKVVGIIKFDYLKIKFRIWDYFSMIKENNPVVQVRFSVYNPANIMPSLSIINFKINIPPQKCVFSVSPSSGIALETSFIIQFSGCITKSNPITYQFFYYNQQIDQLQEIQVPQNILRRQIQDQFITSSIRTVLPSGDLVIMGQAMDSNLAIFNSTVQISVRPYDSDEQSLLKLIENAIEDSQNTTTRNAILQFSIIAEEISKNNTIFNLPSVNEAKIKLIQSMLFYSNKLPTSSFLSTLSNKLISNLQSSLIVQQDQQSQNLLGQVNQILNNQQSLMKVTNNKLMSNNDIVLQNLVDSFKILNSTTQNFNAVNSTNSLLQTQLNMSDQIGQLINNISIPNQGQFQMQGNQISLNCEQVTQKNLQKYYYDQGENLLEESNIYNVVITKYEQNPFNQSDEFQNYVNQLKNQTPSIQISQNPVIKPLIQDMTNQTNQNVTNKIQMQFPNIKKPSKNNLTCIQQQKSSWSSKNCVIVESLSIGGYNCICKDQKPTTIIEDLEVVLNNKNLQTAFGSEGFSNITHFSTFYEFAIFWILTSVTLIQFGLCWFGKQLDKKQQICIPSSLTNVAPIQENNISNHRQLQSLVNMEIFVSPEQTNRQQNQEQQNDLKQQNSLQQQQYQQENIQDEQEKLFNEIVNWKIKQEKIQKPKFNRRVSFLPLSDKHIQDIQTNNDNLSGQKILQNNSDKIQKSLEKSNEKLSEQEKEKQQKDTSIDLKDIIQNLVL